MDKVYNHKLVEARIYKKWEEFGSFTAGDKEGKKPYVILMPPPNANASLHAGHAMYTIEDLIIRWKRMQGFLALWIPGLDHAGIETQTVYEKHLAKQGKSRMDFDRITLYNDIYKFVQENSGTIYKQFKTLGFSADWSRSTFTLDDKVIKRVFETFKKLHDDELLYRTEYLVNYCVRCGTTLADLEVKYIERDDPLYYMKYGPFTIATVRPETKFRDTALAVNPKDKRYKNELGKTYEIMGLLGPVEMTIIADEEVDPKFGTGIMKVTPAHDPHDFELGKRYNLPVTPIIDFLGRMDFSWFLAKKDFPPKYLQRAQKYHGKKVAQARQLMVEDLKEDDLLIKTDKNYSHRVPVCYRCGHDLEALVIPNWFIKVGPLKEAAIKVVKEGKIKFVPKRYVKEYYQWMETMHDWPISRQIVWGIRIPVWYKVDKNSSNIWVWWLDKNKNLQQGTVRQFLDKGILLSEIEDGLQKVSALPKPSGPDYVISMEKPAGADYLPETDTFDTWFSSGQWPLVTLGFPDSDDFRKFYPTDLMGTLSDIIRFWISRMIMFGLYLAGDIPFKTVYLWSVVVDSKGQKMSKSKGNVVDPSIFIERYGADALRMSLIYGIAPGSRVPLSESKVRGMRNFANKLWNIGRFIKINIENFEKNKIIIEKFNSNAKRAKLAAEDKKILTQLVLLTNGVSKSLEEYRFDKAAERLYEYIWHTLADNYVETAKEKLRQQDSQKLAILVYVFLTCLTLLHPFMPYITEEIRGQILGDEVKTKPLIISAWPKDK